MTLSEAVNGRRSIKVFDADHEITDAEINKLMELVVKSPTSYNTQNWRFCIVRNKELRVKMREVSKNQAQVTDSSAMVIICGDKMAWSKDPKRYWKNYDDTKQEYMEKAITTAYTDNMGKQRDEALRSGAMAAMTLMLAAKDLGYDTCPMTGFHFDSMAELINMPDSYEIVMMVALGKRKEDAGPRGGQIDLSEVVSFDSF